jgi:succinate-semialdehyde dehydrogenase/glutarate-semialdehyde dehydrogenase
VDNPATGQAIATLPRMKGAETLAAIAAAETAFPEWAARTAKQRGAVLRRCAFGCCACGG